METHAQRNEEPIIKVSFDKRPCRVREGDNNHDSVTSGSHPGCSTATSSNYAGSLDGDRPYTPRPQPVSSVVAKISRAKIRALRASWERWVGNNLNFFNNNVANGGTLDMPRKKIGTASGFSTPSTSHGQCASSTKNQGAEVECQLLRLLSEEDINEKDAAKNVGYARSAKGAKQILCERGL